MTTTGQLLGAIDAGVRVFDLGRPMSVGMAQSPNHPEFRMVLVRRHGDSVRADGASAANELIITGGHVGTHIDALAHVSQGGLLYDGINADDAQRGGRFSRLGVETIAPMVCRGWLLDVPAALGLQTCAAGYEITPDDLARTVEAEGITLGPGGVILVRSGWARHFEDKVAYVGHDSGVPGTGEKAAQWLADRNPIAVGADSIAFEWLAPGAGHSLLPAHRVLLVEAGVHIIEALNLEDLAAAGVHEFLFVLSPLAIVGATGSPVRPLAVVGADR